MFKVRDLMTPDPLTLAPEETLRDAAERLTSEGIGGAPVVSGGKVVGVVSLADILRLEVDEPGIPTSRPDLLGPLEGEDEDLVGTETVEDPLRWFVEMWDDVGADVVSRLDAVEGPEWDALDEHTVSEVMTRRILTIQAEERLQEAARRMERARVHRLLVVEGDEMVGILTSWDLVRGVAKGVLESPEQRVVALKPD